MVDSDVVKSVEFKDGTIYVTPMDSYVYTDEKDSTSVASSR